MIRFIAIDPSSLVTGWAVFEDQGLIAWGKIDASKVEFSFRFQYIVNELIHLCQVYHFTELAVEDVKTAWHSTNRQRNIAGLQIVFTSIRKWAEKHRIPLAAYNPATWKNAVVGHVHASKETTKENACLRFPALPRDLSEHEYDAIAIGVYHSGLRFLEALAKGGQSGNRKL